MKPGDVIIINDPYLGGTHLMDVRLVKPFFRNGKVWAWLANSAHWADIGGSVAGGFSSDTWEVHQEGLRLPPIRIAREGKLDEDLLALILANCRVPQERVGDFKAQMAALHVGERRLHALLDRYGVDTVDAVIQDVRTRAEAQMRAHIEALPDGRYTFEAPMDSDGIRDEPLWVRLALDVKGSELTLDFSRQQPAVPRPDEHAVRDDAIGRATSACATCSPTCCSTPAASSRSTSRTRAARSCTPSTRSRSPAPPRNARSASSRPCSARSVRAMPDRAYAGPFGTAGNFSLGGYDPKRERHYVMYYFSGGGYGGYWAGDGHTNACATIALHADAAVRGAGVALSGAVRGRVAARRLGRRRRVPRRMGHQLSREAAARRGVGGVHDGSRTVPAVRARRRHHRCDDRDRGLAGRHRHASAAHLEGHRLRARARRLGAGEDARRRRLGRSAQARSRARGTGRAARLRRARRSPPRPMDGRRTARRPTRRSLRRIGR